MPFFDRQTKPPSIHQQLEAIRQKLQEIETHTNHLDHIIRTMQDALKQRGIIVTISGEMVTLSEPELPPRKPDTVPMPRLKGVPARASAQKKPTSKKEENHG